MVPTQHSISRPAMHTLHVISSMDPKLGGVCQAVRTMIGGLATVCDCHNEVVTLDPADSDYFATSPFPIHALGPAKTSWAYSTTLSHWLLANLPRFDFVIVHGLWQYPAYAVRKAIEQLRQTQSAATTPMFYIMPHGMLDPYFQRDPSRRLKALRNSLYWKLIERRVVNQSDGLLFTCEDEKLLAREAFPTYQPKRELVVGLGVEEPPSATPAMKEAFGTACPRLNGQPYLLFLSRIHPKKGVDLLIRAYSNLAKAHLSGSGTTSLFPALVIAGPLDSNYAQEMQHLASELLPPATTSRAPKIHFPGMLSGDAKWGAFHGCEAFILPSHQENFGIAVVEALACGKPVLISKQVNIWREIVAGRGGIAEDDHLKGTEKLLEEWQSKVRSTDQVTSINARKCFENHYSIEGAAMRLNAALSA
jgi:glycosyltransferase involved in cell wall biosynthesis